MTPSEEVRALYRRLIEAWNNRNAGEMAARFTERGEMIGFDGSREIGREAIFAHLEPIFESHPTAPYVAKVKDLRYLGPDVAILRAIAGMIPPGRADLEPSLNVHHTVVAVKKDDVWEIELFQNTPAQFFGRPELVEQMTEELRNFMRSPI